MRFKSASLAAMAVLALTGTARLLAEPDGSAPPAGQVQPDARPILRTQQFESGELRMCDVESTRLETFLQDLNRRKDYDWAMHGGRPGPNDQYLWSWVTKTQNELLSRGYYFDGNGNLHRPGAVVPLR